jgi:hypothetical protein
MTYEAEHGHVLDGELTQARVRASAALPLERRLIVVSLGPRETDPVIRSAAWCAWAKGPNGERAEGIGPFPQDALYNLAERLRLVRGDPNG